MTKQEQKHHQMTTAPIPRLIWTLAVPTIVSMLISSIYNLTDTFYVGMLSTQATAAVGIVVSVMALIQAFGFFFGHGAGNFISRKLGNRETDTANQMGSIGFFLAILFGLLVTTVGTIFLEPIALLLGSTPTTLPHVKDYLRLILFGAPFMMSSLVLNNMLRYQGNAMYGMVGMVSGAIVNIGLDPLFIFGFDMGVSGAAMATLCSQIVSFSVLLVMNEKSGVVKIRFAHFRPTFYFLKELFRGGVPSLLRQGIASFAIIFMNTEAARHGDVAIAAMSIVGRVMMLCGMIMIGFAQGFQPVCGFNYGAKLYHRVREAFKYCNVVMLIFLVFGTAVFALFAPHIVAIFRRDDAEVIAIGTRALRFQCIALVLGGYIAISNMMLQTLGMAAKASLVASARQGLFYIPLVLILPRIFGLDGLLISQAVSDILTFSVAVPLTVGVLRRMR